MRLPEHWSLLAVLLLGLALAPLIDTLLNAQSVLSDWHAYYRAAANLLAGNDIYAEGKLLVERRSYDYWLQTDGQYVYPPLLALLVTPLAAVLDIGKSGDVWLILLALATVGSLATVLGVIGRPWSLPTVAATAGPVLASVPLLLGVRYGQVDILLALLTLLALLATTRGRPLLAGMALGVCVAIKPTLGLYALPFLRKRQWLSLGATIATAALLGLGPLLLVGAGGLADWLLIARYFANGDYPTYPSNQSLRGWLLRALVGGPRHSPLFVSEPLALGLWLIGGLIALALWWRMVDSQPTTGVVAMTEYGLTAVLILLISPLSEDIHYVMLLGPLAVLGHQLLHGRLAATRWSWLALAAIFYFLQPWLDFAYNRGGTGLRGLVFSGAYLYGLALVGLALLWLRRDLVKRERTPGAEERGRLGAPA